MKVSVIVPVYNVERYLARCLDSVIAAGRYALRGMMQLTQVETVCVNDGSTDGSAAVLEEYRRRLAAAGDLRLSFRVVTQANGGLGSARNAGMAAATGDYFTFVDSDDEIPPYSIVAFAGVLLETGAPLAVSCAFEVRDSDSGSRPSDRRVGSFRYRLRRREWICGRKVQYSACNKMYAASLIRNRPFPKGSFEDFSWTTSVFCDVDEFAAIRVPLYVYCRNAGASSIVRSAYTDAKNADAVAAVRRVLGHAGDGDCREFALRQAADGLSSTIGQTYRSRDRAIAAAFLPRCRELLKDFPELRGRLAFKARFRLWRLNDMV